MPPVYGWSRSLARSKHFRKSCADSRIGNEVNIGRTDMAFRGPLNASIVRRFECPDQDANARLRERMQRSGLDQILKLLLKMLHHLWRMAWRRISEEDKIDVRLGEKSAVQATLAWQHNDILVGAMQERILDPMTEIVDDLLPDLNVGPRGIRMFILGSNTPKQ
jgi:hypothetical protein